MAQRNNFLGQVLQNSEQLNRFLDSLTTSWSGQSNPMPTATQPTAENQSRKRQSKVDTNINHAPFSSPTTNQFKKSRTNDVAQQAQVQQGFIEQTTMRTENNDGLFHQYPPVPVLPYEPNANWNFQAYPSQEVLIFQNNAVAVSYNSMPNSVSSATSCFPEYTGSANYHGQQFMYHSETPIESTNSNNNNIPFSYYWTDNSLVELEGGVNSSNINMPLDNNNASKQRSTANVNIQSVGFVTDENVLSMSLPQPVLRSYQQDQTITQLPNQPLIEGENIIYGLQPTQGNTCCCCDVNVNVYTQNNHPTQWSQSSHYNIADNNNTCSQQSISYPPAVNFGGPHQSAEISENDEFAGVQNSRDPSSFFEDAVASDDNWDFLNDSQWNNNNTPETNEDNTQIAPNDISTKNNSKKKPRYVDQQGKPVDLEEKDLQKALESGAVMTAQQWWLAEFVDPNTGKTLALPEDELDAAKKRKEVITRGAYIERQRQIRAKNRMLQYIKTSRQGVSSAETLNTKNEEGAMKKNNYMRILHLMEVIPAEDATTLRMLLKMLPHPNAISMENKKSYYLQNGRGETLVIQYNKYRLPYYNLQKEAGIELSNLIEKTRKIIQCRSIGIGFKVNHQNTNFPYRIVINHLALYNQWYLLTERIVAASQNKASNQQVNNTGQSTDPNNNNVSAGSEQNDLGLITQGHSSPLRPNTTNVSHRELFREDSLSQNFYHQTQVNLLFAQGSTTRAQTHEDAPELHASLRTDEQQHM